MAKAKKFGTFSGVFTPSILTILGVIMYLRFPAIIGQAGLINTIGIIVIAHIISITTSLSVASLSTDKPVQNGGTYFMISRSLGLPIGGTLGLALFVGLSFSVSLYLIGFAESFLQYWGLENNINTIRLTGSIVLLAVTTITFISTSLAIKSQYFIMAAIGLSLLSILFGKHDFVPEEVNIAPLATSAPFMVLFGIFFPAVTGFEAGVSMSGDLQNPKKSLPVGAMMAVGIGFIVYIGLAFFYAYTVDAKALVNDPQILFKISLVPALVIAGIWGATLSSALGSILGAPRILQAIAMDKIAPKFFAKGKGKTNEPRNALLLAFVIAEAGILIGELDVIARIVSMFFITTYAFLNLASAIESWSSSDFRPAFKIPRFVSVLGTLSAFIVMVLLDFLALAGAIVVLGLLYFVLQRKELILESGDAWSSFWKNFAKRALLKLSMSKADKRNWSPNIILFSGGEKARPHLVEMGLALTGKLGALTDFNLSVGEGSAIAEKPGESIEKNKVGGYFTRQLECDSIEEGIKSVTNVYGFSGFEPNTVLMGWSKSNKNSGFLSEMLKDLTTKKLNAVFLDYDKKCGFKDKESIDIWWNGKGSHLSFSLNMLRFLLSDATWLDARVRIIIINSDTSLHDGLYRNTNAILLEKRINAEVKVISDDFGSRTKEEIINTESVNTALIVLGLSQKSSSYYPEYIQKVNAICEIPASILLLSPAEEFEEINLLDRPIPITRTDTPKVSIELVKLPEIEIKLVKNKVEKLDEELLAIGNDFCEHTLTKASEQMQFISSNMHEISMHIFNTLKKEIHEAEKHEHLKIIDRNHIAYLRNILKTIQNDNEKRILECESILQNGVSTLFARMGNYVHEATETITVPYFIVAKKKERMVQFPYKKMLQYYFETKTKATLNEQFIVFEQESKRILTELQKHVLETNDKFEKLLRETPVVNSNIADGFSSAFKDFEVVNEHFGNTISYFSFSILSSLREISIEISENLKNPKNLKNVRKKIKGKTVNYQEDLSSFAETWGAGIQLLNNTFYLDILVLSKKTLFKNIILKGNSRASTLITDSLFSKQKLLVENLKSIIEKTQDDIEPVMLPDDVNLKEALNEAYDKALLLMDDLPEEQILPELIYKESELIPFNDYNQVSVNISKSAFYYLDILFHEPLYHEYENLEAAVKRALIESKEANSMLLFHQRNLQNAAAEAVKVDSDVALFKKLLKQIEEEKVKVETALERMHHYTDGYISEAFSKLFYHSVMDAGKNIHSGERQQKSRKFSISLAHLSDNIKNKVNSALIYVLNSASSGLILSKKYLEQKKNWTTQTKEILDLVDALLPDTRVYSTVPVYYRNLMSSSSKITDEFWIPRTKEMETIKEALYRHKRGYGGAVIVTGVHGAGKTTLTRYAVSHLFKPQNTIWVNAPAEGTTNSEVLHAELKKHTGNYDAFSGIFNNMPFDSVIVINDLELWWERRPGGGEALQKIFELIKLYSTKVFFIINCNKHAFNAMQQIYQINQYSLATISCSAFNTKELQKLILQRHKSSGLTLLYKGREEEKIPQLTYSVLFNRYFSVCEGIPGAAINTWKASITNIHADTIEIKKPDRVTAGILHELPNDWLMLLSIFLQHKNLDTQKLSRITAMNDDESARILLSLSNAGLIVKKSNNMYSIGRNVEPLITDVCENKGLI